MPKPVLSSQRSMGSILFLNEEIREPDDVENALLPKRPQEELPIGSLGRAELDSLVEHGHKEAEATELAAGFMGGAGPLAVRGWVFLGCSMLAPTIFNIKRIQDENNEMTYETKGYIMVLFLYFVICVFAIARGIFLHFKQFDLAIKSLAYMLIFLGVSLIVVFIHRLIGELWCVLVCAMFYIIGVTISTTGILLLINQRKLASDCFNLMILEISLAGLSMAICAPEGVPGYGSVGMGLALFFPFMIILGLLYYRRIYSIRLANEIVKIDKEKYDTAWSAYAIDPKNAEAIVTCEASLREGLTEPAHEPIARRYTAETRSAMELSMWSYGSKKPRQCIKDLFVLISQAHALNDHFQACVEQWAKPPGSSTETGTVIHSCPPKRLSRSIEKLHRSYRGDAGRLIDLVRSAITFDDFDMLVACVKGIVANPEVAILNYKNRFAADYDSSTSAGYRNVSISLIIVDDFTMGKRLDRHVCELQLGLKVLNKLKKDGGHKRYVQWRNLRAE